VPASVAPFHDAAAPTATSKLSAVAVLLHFLAYTFALAHVPTTIAGIPTA
jgi:hypothetical protein